MKWGVYPSPSHSHAGPSLSPDHPWVRYPLPLPSTRESFTVSTLIGSKCMDWYDSCRHQQESTKYLILNFIFLREFDKSSGASSIISRYRNAMCILPQELHKLNFPIFSHPTLYLSTVKKYEITIFFNGEFIVFFKVYFSFISQSMLWKMGKKISSLDPSLI